MTRSCSGSDASQSSSMDVGVLAIDAGLTTRGKRKGKGRVLLSDRPSSDEGEYGKRPALDSKLMPPPIATVSNLAAGSAAVSAAVSPSKGAGSA